MLTEAIIFTSISSLYSQDISQYNRLNILKDNSDFRPEKEQHLKNKIKKQRKKKILILIAKLNYLVLQK